MAIAIASTSTVNYLDTGDSSDIIIPKPTGLEVGDVLFGIADSLYANSNLVAPDGWTVVTTATNSTGNGHKMVMAWTVATSDDVAAENFVFNVYGGTRQIGAGLLYRITGANTSNLVDAFSVGTGSFGQPSVSGFTPDKEDNLYILAASGTNVATSVSGYAMANENPSWTESFDENTGNASDGTIGVAWATRSSANATGEITVNFADTSILQSVAILVALSPQIIITEPIVYSNGNTADGASDYTDSISTTVEIDVASPFVFVLVRTNRVGGGRASITSITCGGVAMTELSTVDRGTYERDFYYYLSNPSSGTKTIAVSFDSTTHRLLVASVYGGVNSTSPINASSSNLTATSTVKDCRHIVGIFCGSVESDMSLLPGAGTTKRDTVLGRGAGIFESTDIISPAGENTLVVTSDPAIGLGGVSVMLNPTIKSSLQDTSSLSDSMTCIVRKVIAVQDTVGVKDLHVIPLEDSVAVTDDRLVIQKGWEYLQKVAKTTWRYLNK